MHWCVGKSLTNNRVMKMALLRLMHHKQHQQKGSTGGAYITDIT